MLNTFKKMQFSFQVYILSLHTQNLNTTHLNTNGLSFNDSHSFVMLYEVTSQAVPIDELII